MPEKVASAVASGRAFSCRSIALSPEGLRNLAQTLQLSEEEALAGLARAISTSPGFPTGCTTIVARQSPRPVLALVGFWEPQVEGSLRLQASSLEESCRHLRFVNYRHAEEACEKLASHLVGLLGPDGCRSARFVAIPRGGLIVLGLMAGILGLQREQLDPPSSEDHLVVVIDDCSLSGSRLATFLSHCPARRIVFAPLFSTPELRSAVLTQESRVVSCCSAYDLDSSGAVSPRLGQRESLANGGSRFWIGNISPIAFPWNEPDRMLWNPETERHELAWHIVPPELCLKNRLIQGTGAILVQIQPATRGPLRPSDQVLFAEIGEGTLLCDLVRQKSYTFTGAGSDLWRAIVRHGQIDAAAAEVAVRYDAPEDVIRQDAQRLVDELLASGLLEDSACPARLG